MRRYSPRGDGRPVVAAWADINTTARRLGESPLLRATLGLPYLLPPPPHRPDPLLLAGRYRTQPLATTGNSSLFLAQDQWLGGRELVVKVIEGERGAEEALRWRVISALDEREAAHVVRLRHQLTIAGAGAAGVPRTLLCFDRLVPLAALAARLQTLAQLAAVGHQLLVALAFLHRHGLVHADLKLENLLCVPGSTPDAPSVRLGDFGNALRAADAAAYEDDFELGTLTHRAPELLLGVPGLLGTPLDLWAAGCVLLELYSRAPLFAHPREQSLTRAEAVAHVLARVRLLRGPFPATLRRGLFAPAHAELFAPGGEPGGRLQALVPHAELAALLERLLALDPGLRASALEALQMPLFAHNFPLRLLLPPPAPAPPTSALGYPPTHPSSALPLGPPAALRLSPSPPSAPAPPRLPRPQHPGSARDVVHHPPGLVVADTTTPPPVPAAATAALADSGARSGQRQPQPQPQRPQVSIAISIQVDGRARQGPEHEPLRPVQPPRPDARSPPRVRSPNGKRARVLPLRPLLLGPAAASSPGRQKRAPASAAPPDRAPAAASPSSSAVAAAMLAGASRPLESAGWGRGLGRSQRAADEEVLLIGGGAGSGARAEADGDDVVLL